jgi:PAS domain S-box-containing protein
LKEKDPTVKKRNHHSEDSSEMEALRKRLEETENALQAVIAGEVDAVAGPQPDAPVLLRQTQEALRASQARYQRLTRRMSAIVFELTPEGAILDVNDAIAAVCDYQPADLIGRNWWEVFFPGELSAQVEPFLAIMRSGDVSNCELVLATRQGRRITLELNSANYYGEDGGLERIVGFGVDITQRKQIFEQARSYERQLVEAQSLAHIGSWDWEIPTKTVTCSQELYKIFGLDPRTFPLVLDSFLEMTHPDERQMVREAIQKALAEKVPFAFHIRITRPDGERRVLSIYGEVVADAEGAPVRMKQPRGGAAGGESGLKRQERRIGRHAGEVGNGKRGA